MLSRRQVLAGTTAGIAQAALGAQTAARKPNVVIFLADDLGCHDLGAWGAADLGTPNIDALAQFAQRAQYLPHPIVMIMNWPGAIPKGKVVREVGSHLDLLPTIVKAAGASVPADRTLDGSDAIPMAAVDAKSSHDAIFWSSGGQLAVRRGPWKLVKDGKVFDGTPDGNKALAGEDALFLPNLEEDPGESGNLRRRFPGMVDELATLMQRWSEEVKKW